MHSCLNEGVTKCCKYVHMFVINTPIMARVALNWSAMVVLSRSEDKQKGTAGG